MNEHTCKECLDFIDAYIEGELEGDVKEEFEKHLAKCPPCIDYVNSYERTVNVCRELSKSDAHTCSELPDGLVKAIIKAKGEESG